MTDEYGFEDEIDPEYAEILRLRDIEIFRQIDEEVWTLWRSGRPLPATIFHGTRDASFSISPEPGPGGYLFAVLRYGNRELGRFFGPTAAARSVADGEYDHLIGKTARFGVPQHFRDWKP